MSRLLPLLGSVMALLTTLLLAACGKPAGGEAPLPTGTVYPEGTVLALNGLPIRGDEVDRVAAAVASLYPEYSRPHCRRLAVTNALLPRYALRRDVPEARERALAEARKAAARLAETPDPEDTPQRRSGTYVGLGLDLFAAVDGSEPGRWSAPLEVLGRFVLVRPAQAPSLPLPDVPTQARALDFDLYEFPYQWPLLEGRTVDDALEASHLEVVDPDWDEIVPGQWKYRMRAYR